MNDPRLVENTCCKRCVAVILPSFREITGNTLKYLDKIHKLVYLAVIMSDFIIQWFSSGMSVIEITKTEEECQDG